MTFSNIQVIVIIAIVAATIAIPSYALAASTTVTGNQFYKIVDTFTLSIFEETYEASCDFGDYAISGGYRIVGGSESSEVHVSSDRLKFSQMAGVYQLTMEVDTVFSGDTVNLTVICLKPTS